jgi:hypothetical protein
MRAFIWLRPGSWQTKRLFEELVQKLLQQRDCDIHARLFDALASLVPNRVIAGGIKEFVAGPSQPERDRADRLTVAIQDDFPMNQTGFNEQGGVIHRIRLSGHVLFSAKDYETMAAEVQRRRTKPFLKSLRRHGLTI